MGSLGNSVVNPGAVIVGALPLAVFVGEIRAVVGRWEMRIHVSNLKR
jgi:hypothetical protein